MTVVIKRNGRRVRFEDQKLRHSIAAAANEAGVPADRCSALIDDLVKAVTREIGGRKDVSAVELREILLRLLDKSEPRVARAWRDYDRESKGLA